LLGRSGAITVSAYRKSIQDFTYLSNLGEAEGYDELLTYRNGDRGKISGLELGIAHRFTDLPVPWNRFLVSANASISQGSASLSAVDEGTTTKRNVRFPGHAERSSNLVIGYEYAGLSARLAYQQRSNYLLELTEDFLANEKDLFVAPSRHLDFSMHYRLTPQFSLGLEATNLTNQAYYVYQNSKAFNAQYERYGRGLKMMLRAAF
jgi:TonB-dependent receptor